MKVNLLQQHTSDNWGSYRERSDSRSLHSRNEHQGKFFRPTIYPILFVLLFFLVIVVLAVIVCPIVCFIVSRVHHGLALKMFLFLDGAQLVQPISYKHIMYYMASPTRVRKNT